jgi:hypothetical protein
MSSRLIFFLFQLKVAFVNKYQLSNEKKAWRFIKKVANKKCYDTSRKLKKAHKNKEAANQPIGHPNATI